MKSIFNNKFIIMGRNIRRVIERKLFFSKAKAEIKKRSKISFFDVNSVTKNIPFSYLRALSPEINENNDLYGIAHNLKKYANIEPKKTIKASIEHGLYFGNFIWEMDVANILPYVLTFSKYRANIISKRTDKKVVAIGPHLHYAKHFMTALELARNKKKLGNSLIFFPAHSSHFEPVNENYNKLCEQIKKISIKFDNVIICAYWKDYINGDMEVFKKNGFECISAGHMFDPYFLPRLKSIIELSSATASNEIGTILGYSIYMNRPHFLLDQGEVRIKKRGYHYNTEKDELNKIRKEFSKYTGKISKRQKAIVNLYWGIDFINSPSRMKILLNECEKAFNNKESIR